MNADYRERELQNARKELEAARENLAGLKVWNGRKRNAAEQVEFWGNKVAFLVCAK